MLRRLALLELHAAARASGATVPWEFASFKRLDEQGYSHPIMGTAGYRMLRDAAKPVSGRKRGRLFREFADRIRYLEQEHKEDIDG